jgi:threonyl-tRNA synthetase
MTSPELELELPDGTRLQVPSGTTPLEVAQRIGPGLAKASLAAKLEGVWVDLRAPLERGGRFQLLTARDTDGRQVVQHSAEHLMADAVKKLWRETQIDVGRSDHSDKFQYDFDIPARVHPEDLQRIEAEMQKLVAADLPFEREVVSREEARALFESMGEHLKVARLGDIPEDQDITLFRHGDFVDLCRGPHVQRSGQVGAFKLTEISGSYWRGDESNQMLQRIYGVAFASAKELKTWERRLEEAKARDHRKLGAELDLYAFHEWAPGAPFYLPKGLRLFNGLCDYIRGLYGKYGFQEVMAPLLFNIELFKLSGHYEMFPDMYKMEGEGDEQVGLKPMNCPGHCLIFRSRKRSYRELPLRLAEFSRLHRNERSGTLLGMTRVRAMSQDDAHIYCEPEQLPEELDRGLAMMKEIYRDLVLEGVEMFVATRPLEYIGEVADWDRGERILCEALERAGMPYGMLPGEGAFYGPKIECHFKDALGRDWQLSTFQLDMAMPQRFELAYIGRDGAEHTPAMMHRAILGSLERFIGVYLEHTGGDLPLWLAPVQAIVLPVTERHEEYAAKLAAALDEAALRAEVDQRNETLSYRVRGAETQKIPYVLVVGDRETADSTVTVRRRHKKGQDTLGLHELIKKLEEEVKTRGIS